MRLISTVLLAFAVTACVGDAPSDSDEEGEATGIPDPENDPADLPVVIDATIAPSPGCVATAPLGGYDAWFFFVRPDRPCKGVPGSGIDHNAVDELTRLIGSVPPGGRIDGHIFSISVDSVAKALLDAQRRGVAVWLSTDGQVADSTDTSKTAYLDQLTHHVYCGTANNTACISTAAGAISHTKLFVFSAATAPDGKAGTNVVWFGSANQTYYSGMQLYNNTVTIYGDGGLYTQLRSYLGDLYAQRRMADYYAPSAGRGYLLSTSADVFASPEASTDLIVNRLDNVTPDASCRVRVIQASVRDSRLAVVDQLVKMKQGGCKVWVVADTVDPTALHRLKAASIPVHHMPIHDKSFIVYGKFGTEYLYRVYSGSQNLSDNSAHRFDEIFVKLAAERDAAHPVYDAYMAHFSDAYSAGAAL